METSMYKELSYKVHSFRLVSWLIGAVALLLCLLVGMGAYILLVGMNGAMGPHTHTDAIKEQITVIEGQVLEPLNPKMIIRESAEDRSPMELLVEGEGSEEALVEELPGESDAIVEALSALTQREDSSSFGQIDNRASQRYMEQTLKMFNDYTGGLDTAHEDSLPHRVRRSINMGLLGYVPYMSYASFGKFLYNQVTDIAEYRIESRSMHGRKLAGDADAEFLDGPYHKYAHKQSNIVKKSSAGSAEGGVQTQKKWEPMVNQVPLSFVGEILKTLLTLMKEFLMKDHVMECLWFMFCQDVNHQAKYNDMYGMLARVNSVGLKVLIEKEVREADTFGEVFRAVTAWQPLQCDAMFPKCDGSRALEIVNEVALGAE